MSSGHTSHSPLAVPAARVVAHAWNPRDVAVWLVRNDLERYAASFERMQVSGEALMSLTYETLRSLGVLNLRDRARILNAVAELKGGNRPASPRPASPRQSRTLSAGTMKVYGSSRGSSPTSSPPARSPLSAGPKSAPLPRDIPLGLLQHTDSPYSFHHPVSQDSELVQAVHPVVASLAVPAVIPPRTKSIEAFPSGWDAKKAAGARAAGTGLRDSPTPATVVHFHDRDSPPPGAPTHSEPFHQEKKSEEQRPLLPLRGDSLLDEEAVETHLTPPAIETPLLGEHQISSPHNEQSLSPSSASESSEPLSGEREGRPRPMPRADSQMSLRRHPALRESRSRSPMPPPPAVPLPPSENRILNKRPQLEINTDLKIKRSLNIDVQHTEEAVPISVTKSSQVAASGVPLSIDIRADSLSLDERPEQRFGPSMRDVAPPVSHLEFPSDGSEVPVLRHTQRSFVDLGDRRDCSTTPAIPRDVTHSPPPPSPVKSPLSDNIPPLAHPEQDGYADDEDDNESVHEEYEPTFHPGLIQNMDHFFGERPPMDLICENLEGFFPSLSRNAVRPRVPQARPPTVSGEARPTAKDSAASTSDSLHDAKSLKDHIRETLNRKRLGRAGTIHSSFGRRTTVSRRRDSGIQSAGGSVRLAGLDREEKERLDAVTRHWHKLVDQLYEGDRTGKSAQEKASLFFFESDAQPPQASGSGSRSASASGTAGQSEVIPAELVVPPEPSLEVRPDTVVPETPIEPTVASSTSKRDSMPRIERVWTKRKHPLSAGYGTSSLKIPTRERPLSVSDGVALADGLQPTDRRNSYSQERLSKSDEELEALGFEHASPKKRHTVMFAETRESVSVLPQVRESKGQQLNASSRLAPSSPVTATESEHGDDYVMVEEDTAPLVPSPDGTRKTIVSQGEVQMIPVDMEITTSVTAEDIATVAPSAVAAEAAELSDGATESGPALPRAFTIEPDVPRPTDWVCGPLIGKGSFGKVYYGVNVKTGDLLAVKQVELVSLPPRKVQPEGGNGGKTDQRRRMVDALHREITLLKDLDHDNVVRYLGYDVKGTTINVFLEYVSGGSIQSSIAAMGRFEEPLVRSLTCQILCGLGYLHERAIIHRDIKGGNILLDENGVAKISDFGISKKNEYKVAYRFNSRMSLQGSVHWMAPEVIKAKGYSAKVDIWSLGCLVLEMFTGLNPWKQLDELQTMWRLGKENAPPIPEWLSDDARDFLAKCFAIDPDQRPTAAQLLCHPFADVDPASFLDFRAYKEAAIEQKRLEEEEEDDDEDYDDDEDWLVSRNSVRIARFQSARRIVTGGSGGSSSSSSARRRGSQASSVLSFETAAVATATATDAVAAGTHSA
ncbi:hypothetical protein HKX48_001326, partial [Thoreauomyces humboldtii]